MLSLLNIVRRVRHGMTLGVRVLACDDAGRLLLVRHTYVSGWHLPGGGVDLGETATEAAHRELREETNVEVAGGRRADCPSWGSISIRRWVGATMWPCSRPDRS